VLRRRGDTALVARRRLVAAMSVLRMYCDTCDQWVFGVGPWCDRYEGCPFKGSNLRVRTRCSQCGHQVSCEKRPLRHRFWSHHTHCLPDDSVWCLDCGGIVAVADV
jgi:hypothetical protein